MSGTGETDAGSVAGEVTAPEVIRRRRGVLGIVIGVLALVGAGLGFWAGGSSAALTCTKTWNVVNGTYGTTTNWTPAGLPASTDTICSAAGSTITLGTNQTVAAAKLDGALKLTAGTFSVTGTTDPSMIYDLTVQGSANRAGAAEVRVTHTLTWNGGAALTGVGKTTVAPGATASILTNVSVAAGHTFRNEGTVTMIGPKLTASGASKVQNAGVMTSTPGSGNYVELQATAQLVNTGTLTLNALAGEYAVYDTSGTTSVLNQAGATLNVTVPVSSTSQLLPAFDNAGTLAVTGGDLALQNGNVGAGTDTGTYSVGAGAQVDFSSGTRSWGASATATGAGRLAVAGATWLTAGNSVPNFGLSGGTQTGDLTVSSSFDWAGGALVGAGTTTLAGSGTGQVATGSASLHGTHVFRNLGTFTVASANYYLYLYDTAQVRNAGSMTVNGVNAYGISDQSAAGARFVNEATGTFTLAAANLDTFWVGVPFDNAGSVVVASGPANLTLDLQAGNSSGGQDTGSFSVPDAADEVHLRAGTRSFSSSVTSSGAGPVRVTGADLTTTAGTTLSAFGLSGGTQTGDLTVSSSFDWAGGALVGAGTTTLAGSGTGQVATGSASLHGTHVFRNLGTFTVASANYYLYLYDTAQVRNAGSMTVNGVNAYGISDQSAAGARFVNEATGTFTLAAANLDTFGVGVPFTNDGTIVVNSGQLLGLNAGLTNFSGTTLTGGSYDIGGTLQVSNGGANWLTNSANVIMRAGSTFQNNNTLSLINTLNVNSPTGSLTLERALSRTAFVNNGSVTVNGANTFATLGGYTQNSGTTQLTSATSQLTPGTGLALNGGTLKGNGTVNGSVTGAGSIAPGNSPGLLTVTGNWSPSAGSHLVTELAGSVAGTGYDRLAVSGAANVTGTLDLVTDPLFTPTVGDTFTILTAATRTGTFSAVTGDVIPGGRAYAVSYTPTSVVLTVVAAPGLSVADVSGGEGSSPMTFTVVLSAPLASTLTVPWSTADLTATAGSDYTASSGTLTFNPGEVSKTLTAPVINDSLDENDETFAVNFGAPSQPVTYDPSAIGTILDDDPTPSLTVNDLPTVAESAGNAVFTVTLSAPSGRPVTVAYGTAPGTAVAPDDYTTRTGALTFNPGETTKTVSVPVINDTLDEVDETFLLNLSTPGNATISDGQGQATVIDDDAAPTVSVLDTSFGEGDSGTTVHGLGVYLSAPSGKTVTVDWATSNGTATAPSDYVAASGTVTFTPGQVSAAVNVTVNGDTTVEPDETFTLDVSNPGNATLGTHPATITIVNDDTVLPSMSISDASVTEGNSGTVNATFTVSLTAPSGFPVSASYATSDGVAQAPSDYVATSGTVNFAAGQTTATITVPVNGDALNESDEDFLVSLSAPANAVIGDGLGTGVILNDDAVPSVSISAPASVAESVGNATFTVTLSAPSGRTTQVDYATADLLAVAPADYSARSGSLVFAAGETSKTVLVPIVDDALNEGAETFKMTLSNPSLLTLGTSVATVSITDNDPVPTLVVSDRTITEGDSGTTNADFTVTLSAASGRSVTVAYATADGTAGAPADYAATSGTLTFNPGQTAQTVSVPVVGDVLDENDETFSVNLSIPTNATIADAQGLGTITDNDASPTVSVTGPVTIGEAGGNATYTVSLSAASGRPTSVNYSTVDGTATAPGDYTAGSGTLTFAVGETSKTVSVPVIDDAIAEADETFSLALSLPVNLTIGTSAATTTIVDNDSALPTLAIADASVTEGNGPGSTTLSLTVTRTGSLVGSSSVGYATADGTATAPADYAVGAGTVTFAPGQATATVNAAVVGDTLDENDETLLVNLNAPVGATVSDGQAVATIVDDDPTPTVSVTGGGSITEGTGAGTTTATFTVALSAPSGRTATVLYTTNPGTATAPADYTATSGSLTFLPGETSKLVTVAIVRDALDENDETFTLDLTAPANATVGSSSATATIVDDDPSPSLSQTPSTVAESVGTANVTVTLSAVSGRNVTVNWATGNGTAVAPGDYTAASGTLTFLPGETIKTIPVTVIDDLLNEGSETFKVNLGAAVNATVAVPQAIITISDNDLPPTVAVNDVAVTEGNSGTVNATFTVSLSGPSGLIVTVPWSSADGTAVAPADYTAGSGTLTFTAGQTSKTVVVAVKGDLLDEVNETYFVNLGTVTSATLADGQGLGTITDDDPPPSVSVGSISTIEPATGPPSATIPVTLSAPSGQSVTVQYATANGTATMADYTAKSGTLTFPAGTTTANVSVPILTDTLDEPDETFTVTLTVPVNATLGTAAGTETIVDDDPTPTLTINDVTQAEGTGGFGVTNQIFTVTLSAASGQTVTVPFSTADGTAVAPGDYTAQSGSLTFTPGQTTKTITVKVVADATIEADEGYVVNLGAPTNATLADGQGAGTVVNDDFPPTLSINDVTQAEGTGANTTMTFTVTRAGTVTGPSSVAWAVVAGSATVPADVLAGSGTVSFTSGQTSKTITVTVVADAIDEPNETFTVLLSTPTGATITKAAGVGAIIDDEPTPTVTISGAVTVNEGAGVALVPWTMSGPSGYTVGFGATTQNLTATAGADYTALSNVVTTVNPGDPLSGTISVPITDDALSEPSEQFTIALLTGFNVTPGGTVTVTIQDNDLTPQVTIDDATDYEGTGAGTTDVTFNVSLDHGSSSVVTVPWSVAAGTAGIPGDVAAASGTVTFAPGQTVATTTAVPIVADAVHENDETFSVVAGAPTNAVLGVHPTGTFTIIDDDALVVDATNDATDDNPGDGSCHTAANTCTLRAAVQEANAKVGLDTIQLSSGVVYAVNPAGANEDAAVTGDLDVTDDLILSTVGGPGYAEIHGNSGDRVFDLRNGASLLGNQILIQSGAVVGDGGAVRMTGGGALVLTDSHLSGSATYGWGGAIDNEGGALTLISTFVNGGSYLGGGAIANRGASSSLTFDTSMSNGNYVYAGGGGGAIYNEGQATVTNSAFVVSRASGDGGSIFNAAGGSLTVSRSNFDGEGQVNALRGGAIANLGSMSMADSNLRGLQAVTGGGLFNNGNATITRSSFVADIATGNGGGAFNGRRLSLSASTISANTAQLGGGLFNAGPALGYSPNSLSLIDDTIAGNTGSVGAGGVQNQPGTSTSVVGTIIADQATGTDCVGTPLVSLGYNLSKGKTCGFTKAGDVQGVVSAGLGSLVTGPVLGSGVPGQYIYLQWYVPQVGSLAIGTNRPTGSGLDERGVFRAGPYNKGAIG